MTSRPCPGGIRARRPHGDLPLHYTEEVLDRRTGELTTISLGDWLTVSELGQLYGQTPRRTRAVLRELGLLYVPANGNKQAHRVAAWALKEGLAKHHPKSKTVRHPFDVIGPAGQAWIKERWQQGVTALEEKTTNPTINVARQALAAFKKDRGRSSMPAQQEICWLVDHFPDLGQSDIATILDISQQLVSKFVNVRAKQLRDRREAVEAMKTAPRGPFKLKSIMEVSPMGATEKAA